MMRVTELLASCVEAVPDCDDTPSTFVEVPLLLAVVVVLVVVGVAAALSGRGRQRRRR